MVCSLLVVANDSVSAVDDSLNLNFSALSFQPEADLVSASSNLGPGFTRRYESVATIGGVVVDAVVTIVAQSGNVGNELDTFDQYDNSQHLSAHTKPSGSAESSGKFKVEFVADGTNTPVVLNNVRASIADLDAHEFGTFYGISSYRLSAGSQLSRSGTTAGVYRFHSSTTGASNTDELRIAEVSYDSTSSVVSAFGCRAGASSAIGAGGKCGFTVVIGTVTRTLGVVETVVAQPSYTVTYNANTCTTGTVPAATSGVGSLTVAGNTGTLSQGSNVFLGWNTLANGTGTFYQPGSSIIPSENITLYAICGVAPTADNETSSGASNTAQVIDVLTGDTAGTGATLIPSSVRLCATGTENSLCTATSLTIPGEGTYTVNTTTGVVTFVPLSTFAGTATPIKYVVANSFGSMASATITPTVAAGEVPAAGNPSADNETSSGAFNTAQVIDVLTGDTAGSGTLDPATVRLCVTGTADASCTGTSLTIAGEGTYTVNTTTGVVTFVPLSTFAGTATPIKYVVANTNAQLAAATITPTVSAPPSPPTASPESKSVIPGGSVSFTTVTGAGGLGSGTGLVTSGPNATCLLVPGTSTCDADGVVAIAGEGTYTLVASTGIVTFVADANAVQGTKTAISYRITDVNGYKATSTLTPTIPPPPTADNETSSGSINTVQVIDVVTGDAAGSGATLDRTTVRLCTTGTANSSCSGTSLTVTGEGAYTVNTTTGAVTFVPISTFTGTATPIKYVIADSTGQKASATITPTVVAPPSGPTATSETKVVLPGSSVSFTTVTGNGGLGSGTGLNASATCLFTPGTTTCAGTTIVSGNTYSIVTISGEGTYTLNLASGVVTFSAAANATTGAKTPITYRITDANGLKATSTLTPIIPPPPAANPDSSVGVKNFSQTLMPLNNDTPGSSAHSPFVVTSIKLCDPATNPPETSPNCTKSTVTIAGEGTYVVNADGTVTFTPVTDYVSMTYNNGVGTNNITPVHYTVLDTYGQKAASTLAPRVVPPPAPITSVDTGTAEQGSVVELSPWTNDSPGVIPAGLGGSVALVPTSIRLCRATDTAPTCTQTSLTTADGAYTVDTSTGKVTFTHIEGFEGTVSEPVTYIISNDWTGQSGIGTTTNVLIPTIIVTAQAAPSSPSSGVSEVVEVPSATTTTTTTTTTTVPELVPETSAVLPETGVNNDLELFLLSVMLWLSVFFGLPSKPKSSPR